MSLETDIAGRFEFRGLAVFNELARMNGNCVPDILEALRGLSICLLVMKDGTIAIGTSEQAAEDFSIERGKQLAYQHALRRLGAAQEKADG